MHYEALHYHLWSSHSFPGQTGVIQLHKYVLLFFSSRYILLLLPSHPASHKDVTKANRWSPPTLLPIIITECALDIVTLTHRTGCRLEITRGGPLSCSHLSPPHPPQCSQLFPAGKGSLNECLLCYGFIGLVCGRNLWIKVISHCSTFSQAVKLPFTFVPLRERDRERHM